MKIKVHGEMTIPEIRQALFEQLNQLEDSLAVRYSIGATLFINPSNGFADRVRPVDHDCGRVYQNESRGQALA